MAVSVHGHGDGRVAQPFRYYFGINTGAQGKGGVGMAQTVKGQVWKSCAPNYRGEVLADTWRIYRFAILLGKHEASNLPAGTKINALLYLPSSYTV